MTLSKRKIDLTISLELTIFSNRFLQLIVVETVKPKNRRIRWMH